MRLSYAVFTGQASETTKEKKIRAVALVGEFSEDSTVLIPRPLGQPVRGKEWEK